MPQSIVPEEVKQQLQVLLKRNREIRSMKSTIAAIIVVMIIMITNISGIKEITGINNKYYSYSNYSGTVTQEEDFSKGRTISPQFAYNFWKHESFRRLHPNDPDTILYRHFKINPLKFWRWGEYLTDWRYNRPYIDWKGVRKRRGYDPEYSDGYQEF